MKTPSCAGLMLVVSAATASGQEAAPERKDPHKIEEIVVIAHPLSAEGLAQVSLVLEGDALTRNLADNVGETLARQPGIHNSSFGVAAGRPVVRGLSGPRVRIMEDRLDALDVSSTSADHATTVDPFVAERIEVLKGPSTLLYGSGAIGGVVDVHTGRIPHVAADEPSLRLEARAADSTEQVGTVGELDSSAGAVALHADGFYRKGNDYDIPGYVASDALRQAQAAAGEPVDDTRGRLPGSGLETWGAAGGASLVGRRGFAGLAISHYDNEYDLPGGDADAGDPAASGDAPTPSIRLEQTRYDLEAAADSPFAGVTSVNFRAVYNDYVHREIEPDGAQATRFENQAWDSRLELGHQPVIGFAGTVGVQYSDRDFSARGEEAFVPPVSTRSAAAFWVGERSFAHFDLESGVRTERIEHNPEAGEDRDFSPLSVSLGVVVPLGAVWDLGLQTDYSERAPAPEELYSNGPHLATRSYEIGDPELDLESAVNVAATLSAVTDRWETTLAVYYTDFSGYVYQRATGEVEDGLPVQQYDQDDARFYGAEIDGAVRVREFDGGELWLNGFFDYVNAALDVDGNDNVPRLPPWRVGVGAELRWAWLTANVDYLYSHKQDNVAEFELPTKDFEDLRVYLSTRLNRGASAFEVFLQGRNLTDDDQRYHTSFIKDYAPQPGRTFEAGVRMML